LKCSERFRTTIKVENSKDVFEAHQKDKKNASLWVLVFLARHWTTSSYIEDSSKVT